ncbi:unnamed protein product [Didymodactylos carnosus]|uniref:Uncharacterized protein n=1 Tax=Didymodactylos carnosus TaxID=1234261 RepID=A0A814L5E4_9BILA|nr:unnamed protein product [Didymodactylos carnosus]CAF3829501.1 unnamed protein product [Didymodactylos carnosus]
MCLTTKHPIKQDIKQLPQLILLSFVGNLNKYSLDSIRTILNPVHRNPNKCPISSTFIVNDNYTDYCLVQRLFDNNNEIAITAASNKCPLTNCYEENSWIEWGQRKWINEIKIQRENVAQKAHIHYSHIKGFRTPHLQIDDKRHLHIMRDFSFNYDSSMVFSRLKRNDQENITLPLWPFTLDYQVGNIDLICDNCGSGNTTFQGLWEFPLHHWHHPNSKIFYKTTVKCRTLADDHSQCFPNGESVDLLYELIMYNFNLHYNVNRAPFVIELDLYWLHNNDQRQEAIVRFIENLLTKKNDDIYFVSISQALEWMKYPRLINETKTFWAFQCGDTKYDYDIECTDNDDNNMNGDLKNAKDKEETIVDYQNEQLFRSGMLFHCTWIFLLLILAIIFYDKYLAK